MGIKPRAMARTIPGFFRGVPLHNATEVRADGRIFVQLAASVAVDRCFLETIPYEGSCPPPNFVEGIDIAASDIIAVLRNDIEVLAGEFRRRFQRHARGII